MKRKGVSKEQIQKRIENVSKAFPDAEVKNYDNLIDSLNLPDNNDCHVLAAAIKTNANVIVTHNTKDFPSDYLSSFGLKAKEPDDFLTDIIDLNPKQAALAFRNTVLNRKKPNLDIYDVLEILRNRGLKDTANYLHSQL